MRKKSSRKGDNGRVLIIGGSEDYAGAPLLAAKAIASLRTGIDLVTVAAPEKVAWVINDACPDIITKKLKGKSLGLRHFAEIKKLIDKNDVVLLGNGIGLDKSTRQLINKIIQSTAKPLVIDADALKMIRIQDINNSILTPHRGELQILLKNSHLESTKLEDLGKNINKTTIILAKGPIDTIISKNKTAYNKTGNAGMTVGGTGDILAGLCAGLVAQKYPLFEAAKKAAYINGKAGDRLLQKYGFNFIASDFFAELAKFK
jgi:NAD(P)H-hydrate epimerase